jgi:type II secretory pathway pseudopilin PulG
MFCNSCGATVAEGNRFCANCGAPLQVSSDVPAPSAAPAVPVAEQHTDGKAVASLVLGIFSLTLFSFIAGVPAVILGHMSRSNIRKSMGRLKGDGLALAGLIMGYVSFLAIPFFLIIAAIAIPNLLRARIVANETSALASIRTINVAASAYQNQHPQNGYPATLTDMVGGSGGSELIDSTLASGQKSGYRFQYSAEDSDGDGVRDHYSIIAVPLKTNASGERNFCSDETGVIRSERGAPCTPQSSEVE